jgi:peptidyl-prolyl cis-trans isomerase SurA
LEAMTPTLKNRVTRDERTELSKQALQAKLRRDYMFTENTIVKSKVFALADSTLQQGVWKSPMYPNAEKEGLFRVQDKEYTVKDFFAYLQQNRRAATQTTTKYLEQSYNNYVDGIIFQLVEAKIAQENPTYRYLLKEYYEGILLFEIMEKEVWNKASEDSVGQVTYYNTHISEYQAGERGKTIIYTFNAPEITAPLQELVRAGDDAKIQEFVTLKKIKTESGYYKKSDKPVFQKIPWAKGVYPVENNGMYYLAWLKEILPPGPMSFEEARPAIISDYQAFLEKTWLEQLKKRYRVKVNEKGKQHVLQQLQAK